MFHSNAHATFPRRLLNRTTVLVCSTALLTSCALWSRDLAIRTPGTIIDDQAVERIAVKQIRKSDQGFKGAHLVTVSYNGMLLIAGQVASEALKEKATAAIGQIDKVKTVHNELQVGGPISFVARTNDSWLTTKVKSRLLAEKNLEADHFKVVTENGVVYLMGMVEEAEAEHAVLVASKVYGVQKIVKVFEYRTIVSDRN